MPGIVRILKNVLQTGGNIMPKKPYARTFRYSEETRKILDQYDGDFDSLVHYAFFKAREAEEELARIEKSKERILDEINSLYSKRVTLSSLLTNIDVLKSNLSSLNTYINTLTSL